MHQVKKHIGIRIFLLALFVSYYADITFFTHSHTINGVTVVHSHFSYGTSDPQSKHPQNHSHSAHVLTLIAHAISWTAILLQVPQVPTNQPLKTIHHFSENIRILIRINPETLYLRGPPTYFSKV